MDPQPYFKGSIAQATELRGCYRMFVCTFLAAGDETLYVSVGGKIFALRTDKQENFLAHNLTASWQNIIIRLAPTKDLLPPSSTQPSDYSDPDTVHRILSAGASLEFCPARSPFDVSTLKLKPLDQALSDFRTSGNDRLIFNTTVTCTNNKHQEEPRF